jgi:hypothetical protein
MPLWVISEKLGGKADPDRFVLNWESSFPANAHLVHLTDAGDLHYVPNKQPTYVPAAGGVVVPRPSAVMAGKLRIKTETPQQVAPVWMWHHFGGRMYSDLTLRAVRGACNWVARDWRVLPMTHISAAPWFNSILKAADSFRQRQATDCVAHLNDATGVAYRFYLARAYQTLYESLQNDVAALSLSRGPAVADEARLRRLLQQLAAELGDFPEVINKLSEFDACIADKARFCELWHGLEPLTAFKR